MEENKHVQKTIKKRAFHHSTQGNSTNELWYTYHPVLLAPKQCHGTYTHTRNAEGGKKL